MKKILLILLFFLPVLTGAENWSADWYGSVRASGSTGQYMPFWARTGEDGILPVSSSGLIQAGADISYKMPYDFRIEAGANLVGALAQASPVNQASAYGFVDRLYVSGHWKMLHLDLGMKPRERALSDVSVSGGNISYSRNTRNMPGLNAWSDWIYFEKGHWVGFKGNIAHYQTIDNRYVSRAMIHNKALAVKVALGRKVDFSVGLEHWAQWGGNSPEYGLQPVSLRDYWRVFMAGKGGDDATKSDRINVLGNHLGKECFRLDWRHRDFTMTLQYDKPFEDGSGMKYKNVPDGIWSAQFLFNDRESLVTDLVLEYIHTTWQTGPLHDRPATEEEMAKQDPNDHYYGKIVLGGCDNYFGNSEYRSGWTYYNRTIGLPLILPDLPDHDGLTQRMVSTRLRGCHLGLKGVIAKKVPYALKATYTVNYGVYNQSADSFFAARPRQFSAALEAVINDRIWKMPIDLTIGVYGDVGELYQDSVGLTVKVGYKGFRRF